MTSTTGSEDPPLTIVDNEETSPSRASKQPLEYLTIKEVLEKFYKRDVLSKINVYGVVTYLPTMAKSFDKKDKFTQMTIVDQTCGLNDRLKLNIFSPPTETSVRDSCEIGDIIRFHRLMVQEFNGNPQGVHASKVSSWIRFKRVPTGRNQSEGEPEFDFVGNKSNNTVEDQDRKHVRELREWLATNPQVMSLIEAGLSTDMSTNLSTNPTINPGENTHLTSVNVNSSVPLMTHFSPTKCRLTRFGEISREAFFDVVCQVCGVGDCKGTRFLLVWDGTKSSQSFFQVISKMSALRLSAALGTSKQIAKVLKGNVRALASLNFQQSDVAIQEPINVEYKKNNYLSQWSTFTTFTRGLRTSQILLESRVVNVPPFADSISEGDVRWDKAVGDSVKEDEEVCHIETDKTSIPVKAPFSGVITELCVDDGSTVQAGAKLFVINSAGGAPATAKPAPAPTPTAAKPAPVATAPPPTPAPVAPQPSAATIPTTPPPRPTLPSSPAASVPAASIKPQAAPVLQQTQAVPLVRVPPADYSKEVTGTRTEQRVKMNRMRLRIAQRLKEAQNVNAMLTTFNEIDMSNIMELRKTHGEAFNKVHGIKLGFMSAFVKASAYALSEQPAVNAVIDGTEIVYRDYIDISVAVATPKGLVVPVLRNVNSMNYADIEKGIAALGEKAKHNLLAVEDMDGGTFTISNGGVFGSLFGTPIINPPQSAILGMHGIFDRPVAKNGQVVIRPMMYVALTYDHRLIDGREAVTFLRKIKQTIEDPRTILLSI